MHLFHHDFHIRYMFLAISSCVHDSCPSDGVDLRRRYPGQPCQDLALLPYQWWYDDHGYDGKFLWKKCGLMTIPMKKEKWKTTSCNFWSWHTENFVSENLVHPKLCHVNVEIGKMMRLTSLKIVQPNKTRVSTLAVHMEARNQRLRFKNDHTELGASMNDQWGYPKIDGL